MAKKRSSNAIATEREALRESQLKEDGWVTTRVTKKSNWSEGKDFFGIGDIIALKPDKIRISNVSSYNTYGKVEEMVKWLRKHKGKVPETLEMELAVWKPPSKKLGERFIVTIITQDDV